MRQLTHNDILACISNYNKAQSDAKKLFDTVKSINDGGIAEKLELTSYYLKTQLDLHFATSDHDPNEFLPDIQLINQTYGRHDTLPQYELEHIFRKVTNKTFQFASKLSGCLDTIDMMKLSHKKHNTMTATEAQNLDYVDVLKQQLSSLINTAGYEEIHVEFGKKISDYDNNLLSIASNPTILPSDQLIIKEYNRGLRCKYKGTIMKRANIFLEEDIENSI